MIFFKNLRNFLKDFFKLHKWAKPAEGERRIYYKQWADGRWRFHASCLGKSLREVTRYKWEDDPTFLQSVKEISKWEFLFIEKRNALRSFCRWCFVKPPTAEDLRKILTEAGIFKEQ